MTLLTRQSAYAFVILLGFVSLFADVTYEGARSITGPFLKILGASATAVGFAAGLGELIGYGLRLVFGFVADRTRRYWFMTLSGYAVNLIAVPLLAFAGRWEIAICLLLLERLGKAIRAPARDAMLSHAAASVGMGWGFGLHEAMDQIGAVLGPVFMAAILMAGRSYETGFLFLFIPALIALVLLVRARMIFPHPGHFEMPVAKFEGAGFSKSYWVYLAGVALIAAGYADFPLMAYHFKKTAIATDTWIPLFYSVAMAVDALSALIFGRLFDRHGLAVIAVSALFSWLFAPLVFLGSFPFALAGIVFWGLGMGAQESVLRAGVAVMIPPAKRGTGYGIFNAGYGFSWFLGSLLMGMLYDRSVTGLIVFSAALQLLSVPLFLSVKRRIARG